MVGEVRIIRMHKIEQLGGCRSWIAAIAVLAMSIGFVLFFAPRSYAIQTVPYQMNFQGRLNNASGAPMAAGTYNMIFRIYTTSSGGTAVWTETRAVSASQGVTVTSGGLFSVQLGSVTGLPPTIFNSSSPLYLEVELPTPATATGSSPSWTEGAMSPRNPMESSPYAINSDLLDGMDSSAFATASGSANYLQNTTSPQAANFNISGAGTVGGSFTATGTSLFKNSSNSGTAFQVQNAAGNGILTVDTADGITSVQATSIYQSALIVQGADTNGQASIIRIQGSDGTTYAGISADTHQNITFGLGAGNIGTVTGGQNISLGSYALYSNTSGGANIAIGGNALSANTTGSSNIAIGHQAQTSATGSNNTTIGDGSGGALTAGSSNTSLGSSSLSHTTTGSQNVAIGLYSGYRNTTGGNNTFLGTGAGNCHYTAQFCTSPNLQGSTAVGYEAQVQASYSMVLGSVDDSVNVGVGTTVPLNTFSVAPVAYTTGTASQSGTTVTGSGTTWTAAMVGDELVFSNGDHGVVTGFTDATHLTLSTSQTEASQAYRLHYAGLNVTSTGNVGIGTTTPGSNALSVAGTTVFSSSSATGFLVQNAASVAAFSVNTTTNAITLGSGANTVTFTAAGGLVASGTAQHSKKILLPPEYAGAVLDAASDSACASANSGTMTSGYLSTARMNYYNWTSTQSTAQCYDVVVQVPVPSDFASWNGAPNIQMKDDGNGTAAYAIDVIDSNGTTDANYFYTAPGTIGTSWGNMATSSFNGTYTAGKYFTIKIRLSSASGANVMLGNITLTYNSQF